MAWNYMIFKCGHSEQVQLSGKMSERERTLNWARENKLCPDCYRAQKAQERQQENERAANLTTEIGFVALTGSEKQITWAQSIRQHCYDQIVAKYPPHPTAGWANVIAIINMEPSAKWWIDNRDEYAGITALTIIGANHPAAYQALKDAQ